VHHVPAAQDQHSTLAQRPQLAPEFQMLVEAPPLVLTQLKHRHIRLGVHVPQHAPGAMIESPLLVGDDFRILGQLVGFLGCARRRILHCV
jgi:hypothetical protein